MILLMGNCGASRVAPILRELTGVEVRVVAWTQVDAAGRLNPDLIYVDFFGFDVIAPGCVAAVTGNAMPLLDLDPLRSVVRALEGTPVVYRGVRRPSAGSFGLLERKPELEAWFDQLESIVAGQRVLDVMGLWERYGIPMDDVVGGLGHGEPLGAGVQADADSCEVSRAMFYEARWLESLWASRVLPPIECVAADLETLIRGELLAADFHACNPAWLPLDEAPSASILEAWWHMDRGIHEALRIVQQRGIALALTSRNDLESVKGRFRRRDPVIDRNPGPFAWMYDSLPEEIQTSVFAAHPALVTSMALDMTDFAVVETSPDRPKSEMCRRIADQLGIELTALVFLGASPAECAEVRQNAPEITVPTCAEHEYRDFLLHGPRMVFWDRPSANPPRYVKSAPAQITSIESALRELNIEVDVREAARDELARVEELLILCADMNLTGMRPDLDSLDAILVGTCRDQTMDYGIVSAALIGAGRLINWVCSCEVISHRVAGTLLHLVLRAHPGLQPEFIDFGTNVGVLDIIDEAQHGCASWVSVGKSCLRPPPTLGP